VTASHITNVRNGAAIAANQVLFSNNQIDHFGDDGIDYAASNLAITHNSIHDNLDIGDGNHEDAMQGQAGFLPAGATVNHFQNILIGQQPDRPADRTPETSISNLHLQESTLSTPTGRTSV
jgi:hypothetical protein